MFIVTNSRINVCCNKISCLISSRNHKKPYLIPPTLAQKRDSPEISSKENKKFSPLRLSTSSKLLIQSAIGVFALGFIDAGYSGDWSRIGVISRGTEDLLKAAAFLVIPFCIFLIFSLAKKHK